MMQVSLRAAGMLISCQWPIITACGLPTPSQSQTSGDPHLRSKAECWASEAGSHTKLGMGCTWKPKMALCSSSLSSFLLLCRLSCVQAFHGPERSIPVPNICLLINMCRRRCGLLGVFAKLVDGSCVSPLMRAYRSCHRPNGAPR